MSTIEQALQQAEQMAVATVAEEQEYQYSTQYLRRAQYVSDNTPIEIVNKEIQSMDSEISVKGESISQYIEFRTDRCQDGVDLLDMLFNIHYEKGTYGGEDRPINVRYNDTKMILGWAVPNAAAKESGTLNMCIWATGRLYDNTYIWKTKPKSYVINDGLTIAENIAQPDDNWYVQFVNELEAKIQGFSGRVDDIVQVEESLSTDVQVINEKYDSIIASAETAGQSAASAQASEQNAKESEESAQLYKEQTQQIAEQVKEETSKVYKYKGSVSTYDSLPIENVSNGDVYNVEYDGMNYAWDEANKRWDSLGIVIDLSKYPTTEQIELTLKQYVQKEFGKGLFSGSYDDLSNKPRIGDTELAGNKTLDDFDIASKTALASLSEGVAANTNSITELNSNLTDLAFGENSGSANIFNGKIVDGLLIKTGEVTGWSQQRITSDFIPVEPNTLYTQIAPTSAKGGRYCEYDANKNLVYFEQSGLQDTFTTKPTTKYLRISFGSEYGTTFKNDIAIIKGNATEYEPYIKSNYQLGNDKADKSEVCVNLLKPSGVSIERDGITITKNEDGTYTVNGTATADVIHDIYTLDISKNIGKTFKLIGCPKGGSYQTYKIVATDNVNGSSTADDLGNSVIKQIKQWGEAKWWKVYIGISKGATVSNLTFKPMLTTDLSATYDDFVPYTGDKGRINEDVAELKNDLGGLSFSVNGTTLTITDGTNTWTLSQ